MCMFLLTETVQLYLANTVKLMVSIYEIWLHGLYKSYIYVDFVMASQSN